ncbi:MAG: hypothetical protein E7254_05730 [Lachnospiraceae bacterium]|nr:hypothetical protein [Lachnospiraceae bacterium]
MKKFIAKLNLNDEAKHKIIKISKILTVIAIIIMIAFALIVCNDELYNSLSGGMTFKVFSILMFGSLILAVIILFVLAVLEAVELKKEKQSVVSKFMTNFVSLFVLIFIIDHFFLKDEESTVMMLLFAIGISISNLGVDYWKRDPLKIAKIQKMENEK